MSEIGWFIHKEFGNYAHLIKDPLGGNGRNFLVTSSTEVAATCGVQTNKPAFLVPNKGREQCPICQESKPKMIIVKQSIRRARGFNIFGAAVGAPTTRYIQRLENDREPVVGTYIERNMGSRGQTAYTRLVQEATRRGYRPMYMEESLVVNQWEEVIRVENRTTPQPI